MTETYTYSTDIHKADSSMPKGTWFGMIIKRSDRTGLAKICHIVQGRKADVTYDINKKLAELRSS